MLQHKKKTIGVISIMGGLSLLSLTGCGSNTAAAVNPSSGPVSMTQHGVLLGVGAENEYANVMQQIGGKYLSVSAIMSDPNTDPHEYEASPQTSSMIAHANLIVQNGLGYDDFMNKLESASGNPHRKIIEVQNSLGYYNSTPNPHLWYAPSTMPRVAQLIADDLSALLPAHKAYFNHNVAIFDASLQPYDRELEHVQKEFKNAPVATTEPVCDYMLEAAGMDNKTPWSFQAAIMNGIDPSPQDVNTEEQLLSNHQVDVFLYNQQVVDSLTTSLLQIAKQHHIPVVGVYETMPPNHSYQSWMQDEVIDLQKALQYHTSTQTLS